MKKGTRGPFEVNGDEFTSGRAAEAEARDLASANNPMIPVLSLRTGKIVSWGAYATHDIDDHTEAGDTFIIDA